MSDPLDEVALQQELDAMKDLARLLAPMTPTQRRRLLEWARQFEAPVTRRLEDFPNLADLRREMPT